MTKVCIKSLKKGNINQHKIRLLKSLALKILKIEHAPQNIEVNITLVDNDYIQSLNKKYRKLDTPTDVLAFPIKVEADQHVWQKQTSEKLPTLLADIYISIERAQQQAQQGETINTEIARLLIHGILHILGYEHSTQMFNKQEQYLTNYYNL